MSPCKGRLWGDERNLWPMFANKLRHLPQGKIIGRKEMVARVGLCVCTQAHVYIYAHCVCLYMCACVHVFIEFPCRPRSVLDPLQDVPSLSLR